MNYKSFSATVVFDVEDMILVGRIAGINDVVGFHATSPDGLVAAFHEAVEDYVATCEKAGKRPERSYSGKMLLRVDPEVHAKFALAAQLKGMSINQLGEAALRSFAADADAPSTAKPMRRGRRAAA